MVGSPHKTLAEASKEAASIWETINGWQADDEGWVGVVNSAGDVLAEEGTLL